MGIQAVEMQWRHPLIPHTQTRLCKWSHELLCEKSLQSCLTLCDPVDYSWPGSSVNGIFQAAGYGFIQRILWQAWVGSHPSTHGFEIRMSKKSPKSLFPFSSLHYAPPIPRPTRLLPFSAETLSRFLQSCKFYGATLKRLQVSVGYTLGISGLCCL